MRIQSLNLGRPRIIIKNGEQYSSAINRKPTDQPALLTETGFEGDRVANNGVHGGPWMAVNVYPAEHYPDMARFLGVDQLAVPSFGENFTTAGLLEDQCCIGDVYRAGEATLFITQPRQPCNTLARKLGNPGILKWIHETRFTGFYFGVRQGGHVSRDDVFELVDRPNEGLTVVNAMRARFEDGVNNALLERFAACDAMTPGWREAMGKRLQKMKG